MLFIDKNLYYVFVLFYLVFLSGRAWLSHGREISFEMPL